MASIDHIQHFLCMLFACCLFAPHQEANASLYSPQEIIASPQMLRKLCGMFPGAFCGYLNEPINDTLSWSWEIIYKPLSHWGRDEMAA